MLGVLTARCVSLLYGRRTGGVSTIVMLLFVLYFVFGYVCSACAEVLLWGVNEAKKGDSNELVGTCEDRLVCVVDASSPT